jgi:hypothetical protein
MQAAALNDFGGRGLFFAKPRVDPYDCRMKAPLAFLLLCAIPAFSQSSQSDSSKCLPQTLGPFAFGGAARPATDQYLYPRYFRYLKQWDKCIARGEWSASKTEQFPEPYPSGLNLAQRKVVTREAYEWDLAPIEKTLTRMPPGSQTEPGLFRITTWTQMQQMDQQRKHDAEERDEQAKLVDSRLEKLRSRLGEDSFELLSDRVQQLFHATLGRLVRQPLPEFAMFARYLGRVAMMDRFAANGGDDGTAAAKARDDEQKACGLSPGEEEILRRVADDLQKDTRNDLLDPPERRMVANAPNTPRVVDSAQFGGLRERIDSHIAQLRSDLGEASFEKIEKRVHELYESDPMSRVVPIDSAKSQSESGDR